jgi:peroxiredoxin Q/BCP
MNAHSRSRTLLLTGVISVALCAALGACGPPRRSDGGIGMIGPPALAPSFSAPDQDGRTRTLAEFLGRPIVLYFYPRDGTPGCTREACAFRDAWQRIAATGAQVLGVSTDDVASHARFAHEHNLQFPLLADPGGHILQAYGVSSVLGMASRVTFLIGPDGRVVQSFPHVDPAVHANEVIRAIESLQPAHAAATAGST